MNSIFFQGIITDIFPVQTSANFTKRVFWISEPGASRWPNVFELELHNANVEALKGYSTGDKVQAEIEIRGRKWKPRDGNERIFTSLVCVGIRMIEKSVPLKTKVSNSRLPDPGKELPF